MILDELHTERQKLIREKIDNISLVASEFDPKIKAITSQIESITGKSEKKKEPVVSKKKARAMARGAKNMR